ncbi:MAG: flagellar hook-basal body protein [Lachnospiraceae bacterium]|nr:flagellar hook-basal body protein [Lachnospiraceae bacterium]
MVKGLYTAYTGMLNEQHRMDTITNNMANFDATGFKKEGATSQAFKDVLGVKIKDTSEWNIPKKMGILNMGVKIGENYTDWGQGAFRETTNTFDLALSGTGFFQIEYTDKQGNTSLKYTRDGSFTLTKEGTLVTKDGDYVLDVNGNHITVDPFATIAVDRTGVITANDEYVAQVRVADFEDYNYLEKFGENLYDIDPDQPVLAGTAQVYSGYLEQSNVEIVSEMVQMIAISRQYETNQKVIQTMDSSLDVAVNQLGKLQ